MRPTLMTGTLTAALIAAAFGTYLQGCVHGVRLGEADAATRVGVSGDMHGVRAGRFAPVCAVAIASSTRDAVGLEVLL